MQDAAAEPETAAKTLLPESEVFLHLLVLVVLVDKKLYNEVCFLLLLSYLLLAVFYSISYLSRHYLIIYLCVFVRL